MSSQPCIRFGAYEVDARGGELRKHGIRIKLQDQPLKILLALLEKPGEIVTREELRKRIWGDDTFVDFDHGLSAAVNRLRDALSDSAENPLFIETVARKGYRFIGPIQTPQPAHNKTPRSKLAVFAVGVVIIAAVALWSVRGRGSKPGPRLVPLTTLAGTEWQPALSPEGNQVAFVWEGDQEVNQDIYVKMIGSAVESRLTTDPAIDSFPSWSPDGTRIAFVSLRKEPGIYIVSPLGGGELRVSNIPSMSRPAWLPDGPHLIVARLYVGQKNEPGDGALFLVPVEGNGMPRLLLEPPPGAWYTHPAVAADRTLAYSSCSGSSTAPACQIEVVSLDRELSPAGNPRQVWDKGPNFAGLTWTADNRALIVSRREGGDATFLWRVGIGSESRAERLELAGRDAFFPEIVRSSRHLAFTRSSVQPDIWRWKLGGQLTSLLKSSRPDGIPQFSPDGRRIAFQSARGGDEMAIWLANADGTGWVPLTKGLGIWNGTPRWSPDGRWIAFDSQNKDGHWDIWKVESSGGPPQRLTNGPASSFIPSWSRDGRRVYFVSNRSGRDEIWRAPADGGQAERVTSGGGQVAFESVNGTTLYYSKSRGGSEGIFSVPVGGGEEKPVVRGEIAGRDFAVVREGIYYIALVREKEREGEHPLMYGGWFLANPQRWNQCEIRFHGFSTGADRRVAVIGGPLGQGLTVSPDQKTFLFTRFSAEADLWMIENFR